jgi:hypothetical protein
MQSSKDNFVVEDVIISTEEMQKLNKVLKSTVSTKSKSYAIRSYLGGTCSACFYVPTKRVVYDVGDSCKLTDYYYETCYQKNKTQLHLRLKNMNFA